MHYRQLVLEVIYLLVLKAGPTFGFEVIYKVPTDDNGEVTRYIHMTRSTDLSIYGLDIENKTSFLFDVKAPHDIAIFVTDTYNSQNALLSYNFYIGGANNAFCDIGDIRNGKFTERHRIYVRYANESNSKSFWFSWENGEIQAGQGNMISQQTFLAWSDPNPFDIHGIGIGTGWGATGEWLVKVDVKDKSAGHFSKCQMSNTRSDLPIIANYSATKMSCAGNCASEDRCFGFNYHLSNNRCELLSYGDEPVTSIMRQDLEGWNFHAKCYKGKTVCVGCFL